MTRIDDVTTTITGALNDHDREATGVCSTGRNVRPANMIARALDADGHLAPDLPEQDEIAYPGPTKIWDVGDHHFVEHDPRDDKISLSQSFGEEIRLDPDDIPAAVSALLAAHHERNQK